MENGYGWYREEAMSTGLLEIGNRHGTDKFGQHGYHRFYERHFAHLRDREFTLLEIGIYHGASLRTWEEYFPKARIIGVDLNPDFAGASFEKAQAVHGDARDPAFTSALSDRIGGFDVVIDDDGHRMEDQKEAFRNLFPRVKSGGIYVVEDLSTSYWANWGGGPIGMPSTAIEMLKTLVDDVNQEYHKGALTGPAPISGLHFYRGIAFIERG